MKQLPSNILIDLYTCDRHIRKQTRDVFEIGDTETFLRQAFNQVIDFYKPPVAKELCDLSQLRCAHLFKFTQANANDIQEDFACVCKAIRQYLYSYLGEDAAMEDGGLAYYVRQIAAGRAILAKFNS
jgi:DNA-binding ferritin-like protein (Dps family)